MLRSLIPLPVPEWGELLQEHKVMGSISGCVIPKTLKMVPEATLIGTQYNKASTGASCSGD